MNVSLRAAISILTSIAVTSSLFSSPAIATEMSRAEYEACQARDDAGLRAAITTVAANAIRAVTTMVEPEWDEATRDLALALDAVDLCPVCHGPAYLCQDPEREFDWKADDPIRCHAQTARLSRSKGITDETNPHSAALIFPVRLLNRGSRG